MWSSWNIFKWGTGVNIDPIQWIQFKVRIKRTLCIYLKRDIYSDKKEWNEWSIFDNSYVLRYVHYFNEPWYVRMCLFTYIFDDSVPILGIVHFYS